jgi:hypothetical protein
METTGIDTGAVAREYVRSRSARDLVYHNHKESMAYVLTGFYVTATMALKFPENTQITPERLLLIVPVVVFGIIVTLFVKWQLRLRRDANYTTAACSKLETAWLTTTPVAADLELDRDALGDFMPRAVKHAYEECKQKRVGDPALKTAESLTLLTIAGAAVLAIVRIIWGG